ncbi:hypothetical protein C7T94_11175 [Pedobacter yulinensis]|uniref:HTH araC/xylS-type domain-containing protein n=1 Tax=Pedobacter yulinensis TaxID=2126353 RepID=A0A2T3HL30_9SPHI|nr:AraC family transcriptional regulator [Pedobacter yulinensis]PST83155.1 hypothetical protein C7T94_11175 [Pedobacter yulinensis]
MVFEFDAAGGQSLLEAFASFAGSEIRNGAFEIPEKLGSGYVRGVKPGSSLKLMLQCCRFNTDLLFRRVAAKDARHNVTFTFQMGTLPGLVKPFRQDMPAARGRIPAVKITSANIDYEILIPGNTDVFAVIIVIHQSDLVELFNSGAEHSLLQDILAKEKPYLFEELLSPKMQQVAAQMFDPGVPEELSAFFYRVKAQELICLFFAALLERRDLRNHPLNASDVVMAYQVRDHVIADLGAVPSLPALAGLANMSESKLKRLFRQIFGDSIYNYYQALRMREAANLIGRQGLSVAETGYRLGFTNLSHFARLFERYHGLKPKKYAMQKGETPSPAK